MATTYPTIQPWYSQTRYIVLITDAALIVVLILVLIVRLISRAKKHTPPTNPPHNDPTQPRTIDQLNVDIPL